MAFLFSGQIFKKNFFFSLVDAGTCKNNEKMFLLTGKVVKFVRFLSFYPTKCTFPFPKVIEMVNSFCETLIQNMQYKKEQT